jgi:hypothetical protein
MLSPFDLFQRRVVHDGHFRTTVVSRRSSAPGAIRRRYMLRQVSRLSCQSQSPATDIPAINRPQNTSTSAKSMRLTANHRNPRIRQTHQPQDAREAYFNTSKNRRPASMARCGTVGLVIGFAQMMPAAMAAGKNKRCVNTSQWYGFQSCLSNGFCLMVARVRLVTATTNTTSTGGMSTASNAHSVKRKNEEKKFMDRKVNTGNSLTGL